MPLAVVVRRRRGGASRIRRGRWSDAPALEAAAYHGNYLVLIKLTSSLSQDIENTRLRDRLIPSGSYFIKVLALPAQIEMYQKKSH